jgi:hypothetical protein
MTVLSFALNDRFVLRLIKHYITNPDREWGNTYEFVANSSGDNTDLTTLMAAFVLYEKTLHNTNTIINRGTISTWEADSVPYDPDTFLVQEFNEPGLRSIAGELEPISTCLSVARVPTSGRLGHIFYRGVLLQSDTEAPSGITVLTDPDGIGDLLAGAITAGEVDGYLGAGGAPLTMAMINKTGTITRVVTGLAQAGVVQLPVDHAWFNRTSP